MKLLLKLIAKITGGKVVILQDYELDIYYTIAYPNPFDITLLHARVYPLTRTGSVILNPDGSVSIKSRSCYITRWKYL